MNLYEIFLNGGISLLAVLTLIQIVPIKINPWTKISRAIGKALTNDVIDYMNEEKANTRRYRILRFDDEIRHKTKHTEEHYNQILEDIDYYERYCGKHESYENSKAVSAIKNIKAEWEKCKKDNTFLQ